MQTFLEEKEQPITAVWRNGGLRTSYDSFVVGSSAVLRLNFCAKNSPFENTFPVICNCSKNTVKSRAGINYDLGRI